MNLQEIKRNLITKIDMNQVISFKNLEVLINAYEELAYEKDVLNQTVTDLKAQLNFAKKEYIEINEALFDLNNEVNILKRHIGRVNKEIKGVYYNG